MLDKVYKGVYLYGQEPNKSQTRAKQEPNKSQTRAMYEPSSWSVPSQPPKRHCLNVESIPKQIGWFPNALQRAALNISNSQLKRDKAVLKQLEIGEVGRFGCDRETFKILVHFRQLAIERGRESAITEIYKTYKEQSQNV